MNKYKLINNQTKEEHLCDKVTIDGFNYYVKVEKTLSNNGDWFLGYPKNDKLFKWNMVGIHEGKQVWINKIIATNNSNIDIPKVIDDIEKLANEKFEKTAINILHPQFQMRECYKDGYNKSQETHPFTEEDMLEFAEWLSKIHYVQLEYFDDGKLKPFVELLQMWKEQRTITIYYE